MKNASPNIAKALKNLRAERGLSLSKTAELTGVSKAMLGQIELGQSSPTIATLWKIATGFNVAFSTFLEDEVSTFFEPELYPFKETSAFEKIDAQMRVTPLIPFDPKLKTDLFKIELGPGILSKSSPHEVGVIEHVIVFQGILTLTIDQKEYQIKHGESLRFSADITHMYENRGKESVIFHNLIHYPR
ncbi:XRE family transcriptional regulator [Ignatzschineria rhizosphaerae]|uniref:XRE family transcriptional regulator n=1 Tax=Ignatzschineria rhizosphaerae TaxID=2923279 RepID=A0ABY3X5Y8_9GAMM|nr:XRE family transcriptional regulator [Ignatzschineria rhizosphaerae]UNM97176.1 XRE family transcriptional regulator [Ignatzschineria rhizosphaerae]